MGSKYPKTVELASLSQMKHYDGSFTMLAFLSLPLLIFGRQKRKKNSIDLPLDVFIPSCLIHYSIKQRKKWERKALQASSYIGDLSLLETDIINSTIIFV